MRRELLRILCALASALIAVSTKRRKRLFHSASVTKWTEYENRFYMNWGQIGGNNGWFIVENGNGMNISYRYALQMITGLDYYSK
ncbi:MAG: hypothetical protein SOY07_08230 [Bacteroidales bacterium]|nr:hypothetical protein [Bacteroidales bacterium]